MFVYCECCVLSGRGLCDELITRSDESYRLWYVVVCDLETSRLRRPWPALGRSATAKKKCRWESSLSSCSWRIRRVSCSLILKMKLVPPSFPRSSSVLRAFGLYCSASFGILFVSNLCMCFSHFSWYFFISFTMFCAPVFSLMHWFYSLSSFVIPSKCLKNFICADSKRFSSLFFSSQASLPNFNAALDVMLWILNFVSLFNFFFQNVSVLLRLFCCKFAIYLLNHFCVLIYGTQGI